MIGANRRPLGVVDVESASLGHLVPALVANVHSRPEEVAHRLATSEFDPGVPTLVTDNAGRYLGVLHIRRLLRSLGDPQR